MKRSQINAQLKKAIAFVEKLGFKLPPFTAWTPGDWQTKGREYDEIRDNMLGWDVTDYGEGRFEELGLTLVTIRNGNQNMSEKYPKPYAEKIFILEQGQVSPMHFHWIKMEDIINRGGGTMLVQLYNKTADNKLAQTDVLVKQDGRRHYLGAGSKIRLTPGESISFEKEVFHEITVEAGTGPVLAGEVSQCNDDNTDNFFLNPLGRFPVIEEDESPFRLLCNEYPKAAD
ncbi:MAG: D-lyxose/D-mannose family sugar isomerase [Treponema sp.]|jgi:D-lyxose ketol-isomerase|nr:D-lyxose/D-mannose family sugar isomerase [Treponema sp.]